MNTNRLVVYKAGAGSGKTFQIAKRYLKRLILNQKPKIIFRLIGITFTNKAAEEMKKRIIENLIEASKGHISDVMAVATQELESQIKKQTGITNNAEYQQEIIKRSRLRLQEILHHYDEFQLTTIDKLMYKIIKTFARDMHLSTDVEVEMDTSEVISKLIDNLINKAEPGSLLSHFFINFALENIEDEKHWDIKRDLIGIEKIILNDNHFKALKSLENKTLEDFKVLKEKLYAQKKEIQKFVNDKGNEMAALIEGYETVIYKVVQTYIKRMQRGVKELEIGKTLGGCIDAATYYKENGLKKIDTLAVSKLTGEINDTIHQTIYETFQKKYEFILIEALLNEVNALSIQNELQKEIAGFKETNNRIFISDFNKLILEQILKDLSSDTPYIYMRLGEKYAHYFIDEFQDTSELQWENLIPLVREALSKEFSDSHQGDTMIVGDAKQSIYRFRGGKPEQFIALSDPEQQNGEGNPFANITNKDVENLPFNWRSKENIIKFNNAFFKSFSNLLRDPYNRVYHDPTQKVPEGKATGEGYVNFRFLDIAGKNTEKELYEEAVYDAVVKAQENGFEKEEICILVNLNSKGKKIAEFLNQKMINVVSAETLIVASAGKVRFLISWLYFLKSGNPYDLYDAVRYLAERDNKNKAGMYEELINDKEISKKEQVERFSKIGYIVDYQRLIKFNIYDALIYLIDIFGLSDTTEQAYLQAFLEKVYHFTQKDTPTLKAFLNDWETIADDFSIVAPEKKGAVKIMTVHKAKGLEFPVVIYYTDQYIFGWREKETKVWIPVNPEKFHGFETLPVAMKAIESSPSEIYRNIYQKTKEEKEFDNLNRIYVAFTRAVEQLFVITYQPPDSSSYTKASNIFKDYLNQNYPEFDGKNFEFGVAKRAGKTSGEKKEIDKFKPLNYSNWQLKQNDSFLKINRFSYERWSEGKKAAIIYGMQLHEVLSYVTTAGQWEKQKNKLLYGIDKDLKIKVGSLVQKTINHPELQPYYSGEYQVLNERDILIPSTQGIFHQKRPDRLLLKDGVVTIIDYKTGAEQAEHVKQLQTYAGYLRQAGFEIANCILVYLGENEVKVKFVS